jgi:CrcB protein
VSVTVVCGIGLLGGIGAIARFLLDATVSGRAGRRFPWGTLAVNLMASFALGLLVGLAVHGDALRLAGTGLVGAYSTFSTWALESHRLGEEGQLRLGILNFVVSLVLGISAVWLGEQVGAAL